VVISKRSLLLAGAAFPASAFAQCVINAPAVDACLGGVRNAGPAGATLDLNFMFPGSLDPRITFTRASSATYTDASGVIQTAAINAPRWDYAGGSLRGLLIEEARTNLVVNSVTFAGWSPLQATFTNAVGVAPDGTTSMAKLAEDATNNFHTMIQVYTVTASASYTFSVYAKAVENRYLIVAMDDNAAAAARATFDLQTGTITASGLSGGGTYLGSSMRLVGNGVYRCSVSGTVGASTTLRGVLSLTNSGAINTFPGYQGVAGNGVLVWGGQIEQGAFLTGYIPTTSATVTRAFDNCSLSPANMAPWFLAAAGSWFAEFIDNVPAGGTSPRIIGPNSAGVTPLWASTGLNLSSFDGAVLADPAPLIVVGAVTRGVSAWAAGTGRLCVNGGAVFSGAQVTGFSSLASTGVSFMGGNPGVVNETMTGAIRRVSYWPRVLSDAEMQQVTT
jgi:hypothetical protein